MTKLTKIFLALVLILSVPAIGMATCFNCPPPPPKCGGDGYTGCTTADIAQIGWFNKADITQFGGAFSNNYAEIDQKGLGNKASITQSKFADHDYAQIYQEGWGNKADIDQNGDYNDAIISQKGAFNKAYIDQDSRNNLATITQNGCGNFASIDQGALGGSYYTASIYQFGGKNFAKINQK